MNDPLQTPTPFPPFELERLVDDRELFVQRLVLSLALDPPKALERGRRSRPFSMRRQPVGR